MKPQKHWKTPRPCHMCPVIFTPKRKDQVCCCRKCGQSYAQRGRPKTQKMPQLFHAKQKDKQAQWPTESWWVGKSRSELAVTLAKQMPRLRLAGSDKAGITAGYREVVADREE